jgi:pyruvate,orthophosphate dikinase
VAGVEGLQIDVQGRSVIIGGRTIKEGDLLTMDGTTGEVLAGAMALVPPRFDEHFQRLTAWADDIRRLRVRANADTPDDAARARSFGAEGIGLCRTEHMFMSEARLPVVRQMILANDYPEREIALDLIGPMQELDFVGILGAMDGLPVTIRLLDPPLHEFLPSLLEASLTVERIRERGAEGDLAAAERLLARVKELTESNPMLGTRGCRLGLLYPEIYRMQARAIMRAAHQLKAKGGDPRPEIMIPLVGFAEELRRMRELVEEVIREENEAHGVDFPVQIGTMIELPRAAVVADQIAEHGDFFSFGTNDLTQTVLGLSRDDAEGKFLQQYIEEGVVDANPFSTLDIDGVGAVVRMGCEGGRRTKPDLKLGVCGEHGGDPASVGFFHEIGVDYVSCSPFRVPIARLAAAQAALDTSFKDR